MRRVKFLVGAMSALLLMSAVGARGYGDSFYAETDELGYSGTVWNVTQSTGPWTLNSPRDATLFFTSGAPQVWTDYNQLMSSWYEYAPSNQNDSFLQLAEDGNASVTSANASWDASKTVFSMTVTGANAPYPYSRFWQPDQGMAWGVTFLNYSYTFTATFANEATLDGNNFWVSTGDAASIVGSFSGTFQSTDDVNANPITNGDIYGFNVDFSKDSFNPGISDLYGVGGGTAYSEFGVASSLSPAGETVPLPPAVWGGMLMLGAMAGMKGLKRLRRNVA